MQQYEDSQHINIGVGADVSIFELAQLIKEIVGYRGDVVFDRSKPDGTPRKLLNVDAIHARGWRATTSLREGLERSVAWYRDHFIMNIQRKGFIHEQTNS